MNASQPRIAVFLWLALQRPIRAARFVERLGSLTVAWLGCVVSGESSGSFWITRVFTRLLSDCGD
jgi:hypothetical protein